MSEPRGQAPEPLGDIKTCGCIWWHEENRVKPCDEHRLVFAELAAKTMINNIGNERL